MILAGSCASLGMASRSRVHSTLDRYIHPSTTQHASAIGNDDSGRLLADAFRLGCQVGRVYTVHSIVTSIHPLEINVLVGLS
jgi:hypothetical protein